MLSESEMINVFRDQISNIRSVKKIFMKKRDVAIYDNTFTNVSEKLTEYDVDIIANMIKPNDWHQFVRLEEEFSQKYPKIKFSYHLIENDNNKSDFEVNSNRQGKLIYDAEDLNLID